MTSDSLEQSILAKHPINQIPWCATLLADPSFSLLTTQAPAIRPNAGETFFGLTLATASTVSACLSQQRNPSRDVNAETTQFNFPAVQEVRTFFTIGDGVNGYPQIAHGGFIAAILDEAMGNLLSANKDFEEQLSQQTGRVYKRVNTMTASLSLRFRRPLPTPSTVVVRTWFDRIEGRKHFILATVENGNGEVYTESDAMFLSIRDAM